MGDARPDLEAQGPQVVRHDLGGPHLAIRELRMRVNVAPPGDDLRFDLGGAAVDLRVEAAPPRLGGKRRGCQAEDEYERQDFGEGHGA